MGHETQAMSGPILLDNTVLTNLALVTRSDLAPHLWGAAACTTPQVLDEYRAGVVSGLLPPEAWTDLPILTLTEDESAFADGVSSRLGEGERTCLAIAVHRRGLLVSDDRDARRIAQQYGVPTTGTVGILVLCVQRDVLSRDQAGTLLSELQALGYRSPVSNLDSFYDD